MPTCDFLLRHFRKILLYVRSYAVASSYLFCTLTLCNWMYVYMECGNMVIIVKLIND